MYRSGRLCESLVFFVYCPYFIACQIYFPFWKTFGPASLSSFSNFLPQVCPVFKYFRAVQIDMKLYGLEKWQHREGELVLQLEVWKVVDVPVGFHNTTVFLIHCFQSIYFPNVSEITRGTCQLNGPGSSVSITTG
jgi:hypothetical protein